ncbi:MAG: CHC2 zinc finger domain-containing protein, partial [Flammeovirgaceae bacterium]
MVVLSKVWNAFVLSKKDKCLHLRNYPLILERICSTKKYFSMEIQEIKTKLTLAQVLEHYGLKPDKLGKLNCPFHEDKTPSMQVYYKTQTCYCFSS